MTRLLLAGLIAMAVGQELYTGTVQWIYTQYNFQHQFEMSSKDLTPCDIDYYIEHHQTKQTYREFAQVVDVNLAARVGGSEPLTVVTGTQQVHRLFAACRGPTETSLEFTSTHSGRG